ncbi:MAG: hypothetical protein DMF74_09810, partial [Acidobacteria bacterium]
MQLFDPKNPNEKKKLIAAAVLGVIAIVVLGYVFFGGSSKKPATNRPAVAVASPTPGKIVKDQNPGDVTSDELPFYQPVRADMTVPAVSEPDRNIFAYYIPPPPTPTPEKPIPIPTPTPTPPLVASSLSPPTVYGRTADFSLQVMGDKFTAAVHITMDGRDLPTRFVNAQQVTTTVPAALITNPGTRQIIVRNNDGSLYSNTIMLNVTPPPEPNFNYVGIIAKPRGNDTAVLQDKSSKDLTNVQRGDMVANRFQVKSISEREIVVID